MEACYTLQFGVLASIVGATFIITQSKLFLTLQEISFFRCTMCVGFWVGLSHGIFYGDALVYAFSGSLLSYLTYCTFKNRLD